MGLLSLGSISRRPAGWDGARSASVNLTNQRNKHVSKRFTQPTTPRIAVLFGLSLLFVSSSGCVAGAGREFRNAALPAIRSGATSILNGLLDGLFAAIEPEPQSSS